MTNVVRPCRRARRPSWINASLALAARQLHAALADHRVVSLLEPADELLAVRDGARRLDLRTGRTGLGKADVVRDGAVKQEVVLQDDAELAAIVEQLEP